MAHMPFSSELIAIRIVVNWRKIDKAIIWEAVTAGNLLPNL